MNTHVDVALFLWNQDVIELVSLVLIHRNLQSRGFEPSEGPARMERFIAASKPSVVVLDIAPPYDRSGAVALYLLKRFPESSFVITCADPHLAEKKAPWLCGQRVLQKPYEIDDIAGAVSSAVRRQSKKLAKISVGVR